MEPEKILPKRINRALLEYRLIGEGDRVLIALSGGKDSLALARFLTPLGASGPLPFTVGALHVKAPWEGEALSRNNGALCRRWNLPYEEIPLEAPERDMTCSLCARHRRKALLTHAAREGWDAVALGHHMEDCLETFLMNLVYQSRIDPLLPRRDYPLEGERTLRIIRPLILAQEGLIERWAREQEILPPPSGCPWESTDSRRREMRDHLEALTGGSAAKKLNMFRAVTRL